MSNDTSDIADRLRAARQAQGLSQRELSELAGVPQAQISRIEAGTVDLRLSSLNALAHALGLELALVPRKVMPAVRALSREAMGSNSKHAIETQKQLQKIADAMRNVQIHMPNLEKFQQLQQSFNQLHQFNSATFDIAALKKLQQTIENINRPAKEMAALNESLQLMRTIRNRAAHALEVDRDEAPSRPAYRLDDEDDDA